MRPGYLKLIETQTVWCKKRLGADEHQTARAEGRCGSQPAQPHSNLPTLNTSTSTSFRFYPCQTSFILDSLPSRQWVSRHLASIRWKPAWLLFCETRFRAWREPSLAGSRSTDEAQQSERESTNPFSRDHRASLSDAFSSDCKHWLFLAACQVER